MIEVKQLTKRYGGHTAVSDLSFTIQPGQIYGFLGPNGAGKSTTMNIITGYLGVTDGEVMVDGHSVLDDPIEAKKCISYARRRKEGVMKLLAALEARNA